MSYNGNGVFLINTPGQPVVSGTTITSTAFNALTTDLASGLTNAITKDGQTNITANIPMSNFKITGLGAGTNPNDAVRLAQIQDGIINGRFVNLEYSGTLTGGTGVVNIGSYQFYKDASGNIGIGGVPSVKFEINGGAASNVVAVKSTAEAGSALLYTVNLNASVPQWYVGHNGSNVDMGNLRDGALKFVTNSSEKMRITSNGNVGIGTLSPNVRTEVSGSEAIVSFRVNTENASVSANNYSQIQLSDVGTVRSYWRNLRDGTGTTQFAYNSNLDFLSDAAGTPTSRMFLSGLGNLGLSVTLSSWGTNYKAIESSANSAFAISSATVNPVKLVGNAYATNSDFIYKTTGAAAAYECGSLGVHRWLTAPSGTAGNVISFVNAMTLQSNGSLLLGSATEIGKFNLQSANSATGIVCGNVSGTAAYNAALFYNNGFSALVGQISIDGSTASYLSISDYRLKDNVAPMTGALAKVAQLKPVTYKWKADGSDGQGFIAHELQAVVPDCVTGDKDAVDAEGKPKYQGVDTSFLVATLTAAIQEQQAIISAMETRLAALEA
jgi:hypothetical protein